MGAAYSFVSHWRVAAPPERCWEELDRVLSQPDRATWWRSVRIAEAPSRLAVGETLLLAVRSPLGYRLRPRLTITVLDPGRRIEVSSEGDLRGTGSVELAAVADGTRITTRWDVVTAKRWMNATAFVLRPVFAWAHDRVMAEGERGLRDALGSIRSGPRNAGNHDSGGARHPEPG